MFPGPLDRHPIRSSFRRRARGDQDGGNLLEVCRRANVIVPAQPRRSQGEKENAVVADPPNQMRFISLLLLSAWCGLVAGLLEVATIVVRKSLFDPDHLSRMSRHFVWLVPLSNVAVFLTLGLLGCGVTLVWPRRGRWLFTRVLGALGLLPFLLVAFPRIYSLRPPDLRDFDVGSDLGSQPRRRSSRRVSTRCPDR